MPAHRVHPQRQVTEVSSLSSAKEMPSDLKHKKEQCWLPTRRCLWFSCMAFLVLGVLAAVISLAITFGIPGKPANLPYRRCKTASQQLGFLCEDLTTCLPPSLLCNGKLDCSHGEDESAIYCGQMPSSLPQNLIFKCPNQKTWTYVDKVCDTRNDCGDCSDESVLQCPKCSGWRCDTVFFADCDCIPRTRCKNGIQDCADWSDENLCE
ncbi:low-density lipoprotein receptor class A domain-containing protein 1-like isoform 1-T1 [Hipposideros larvatus]|uniref:Low-density lipoprotein receptor class A domain-containing protein 1-like isoform X1 n=1 Tax=Hipposideros armiger TaxID=186990 RepID=A0A8B7T6B4_HIPAR|nr:PREDICTED: low-density lipoprotein receptor class A domain-containing protein 1-like isoform X1 [Hipposideros armiger]